MEQKNTPGKVSMILGIIAFVCVILPLVCVKLTADAGSGDGFIASLIGTFIGVIVGWLTAITGLVFGIVGLTKKDAPKVKAIVGTVLCAIFIIWSFVG